tara:strand:- start:1299 stop:2534 length:1236 start_codon:yes stop_codon:yes gene_type:complete
MVSEKDPNDKNEVDEELREAAAKKLHNEVDEELREAQARKFREAKERRESVPQKGVAAILNQEWAEYNLKQWNIFLNGSFTGNRMTEYKGRKCAITGKDYVLIPNEKVTEIAEVVMEKHPEWGLTPDEDQSEGKWNVTRANIVESTETKYAPSGTSMFAKYRLAQDIDPTGDGRDMHLGLAVGNSIDLSRGFSIVPYHFRSGCMNSMFHVRMATVQREGEFQWQTVGKVNDWNSYGESNDPNLAAGIANLRNAERHLNETAKAMDTLQRSMRHTKRLTEDFIIEMFEHGMEVVQNVGRGYAELSKLKTNKFLADTLANSPLPITLKNNLEGFSWAPKKENGEEVIKFGKPVFEGEFETVNEKTENQWQLYNQITDLLSHGSLTFNSTLNNMGVLDRMLMEQPKVAKVIANE